MNGVKKALSKTELNSLPEFDFKKTDSKEDDNSNVCSICYEEYASKDKLMALTCTHKFHKKCVKQWLQVELTNSTISLKKKVNDFFLL